MHLTAPYTQSETSICRKRVLAGKRPRFALAGMVACAAMAVCFASSSVAESVTTQSAAEAYQSVLNQGGATKPVRDSVTTYVAKTVREGRGFIPGMADDWPNHGYAKYRRAKSPADKNHNGIPDDWETAHKLNRDTCSATGRDLDTRYDNIEVYLNSL